MKFRTISQLALAAALIVGGTVAQAENKVGVVNIRAVAAASPQTAAAQDSFSAEFTSRERELKNRQADLKADLEELAAREKRESVGLTPAQAQAFQQEMFKAKKAVNRSAEDLQRDVEDMQQEAARREQALGGEIQRKIIAHINRYATDNGFDLILADGVLFASPKLDISEAVLKSLQKEYDGK
jgi:outer membrane protein